MSNQYASFASKFVIKRVKKNTRMAQILIRVGKLDSFKIIFFEEFGNEQTSRYLNFKIRDSHKNPKWISYEKVESSF